MLLDLYRFLFTVMIGWELMRYPATRMHLTFWTALVHIAAFSDNVWLMAISDVGATMVALNYLVLLAIHPRLEIELTMNPRGWSRWIVWARSAVIHLFPVIYTRWRRWCVQYDLRIGSLYLGVMLAYLLVTRAFHTSPYRIYGLDRSMVGRALGEHGVTLVNLVVVGWWCGIVLGWYGS